MKTHGVFDMLFVQIRTKTHLVFFKDGRHKLGFMHINAPQLTMFPFTTTGVFMVQYAPKRTYHHEKKGCFTYQGARLGLARGLG